MPNNKFTSKTLKAVLLASGVIPTLSLSSFAIAQENDADVIVIEGVRRTIQNSIETKREAATIVDALSADDIGDLPALSIGEALETITGAASHREQGGATEISIRGLGPFLGSTVINGREAANGSGDRSVNFSQFPSELFNKLEIYKTQEASLIEGGVSGQISLSTLKPLDYGKRRVQAQFKGNYNPDNADLEFNARDTGYRGTISYVDQLETNIGEFGISLGYQKNVSTNPEQEARSSSGFRDCRNTTDGSLDDNGVESLGDADQNCDSSAGDLDLEVDPTTGVAPDADAEFVLTSSQRSFRQNITDDDRDSVFLALQWQPTSRLDVNFDYQSSDRTFTELRSDLTIDANSILSLGEDGEVLPLSFLPSGALRTFTTLDALEVSSQYVERIEEYEGLGLSFAYDVTENLNVSADYSTSKTSRREHIIQSRLRGPGDQFTGIAIFQDGSETQQFIFRDFDVTDPDNFTSSPRVREDLNQFRNNEIEALRFDGEFSFDEGFITSVEAGVRLSELLYDSVPRVRVETDGSPNAVGDGATANAACLNSVFPESGFLSSVTNGNLITNIDAGGNVIASGTGASYVSFDPICLATSLLGRDPVIPDGDVDDISNVDVAEETLAAYLQANYRGEIGEYPIRGNFGIRIVNTEVTSNGFRGDLTVTRDTDGTISGVTSSGDLVGITDSFDYTEYLPSFNIVVDLKEDVLLRGAIFRAMSRPDPSDLGLGRSFSTSVDGDETALSEVVTGVVGSGNPRLDPLLSWNADAAIEWYPNKDTLLALGLYYKTFNGGFGQVTQDETFTIDGETFTVPVTTQQTTDDDSTIFGVELTATHAFNYLPAPFDGFGAKLSYNYADSDFEFEDAVFGASDIISDGVVTERVGIVPPANVPGLSEHVASAQLYYNIGKLSVQGVYKYRSEYFQQFISTPGNLRYIGDTGVVEARVSYKVNDNVKLSLEGINLLDEPRVQANPTPDSFSEINVYGPRLFAGVRAKF